MTIPRKPKRSGRRSYKQTFLDALKGLSEGEQKLIGNQRLRDELGWDESLYRRIKGELVSENEVIVGRGQGGSVGLASPPTEKKPTALQVFISYSHADEIIKGELVKHLEPLKRMNLIEAWHDRKISAR